MRDVAVSVVEDVAGEFFVSYAVAEFVEEVAVEDVIFIVDVVPLL